MSEDHAFIGNPYLTDLADDLPTSQAVLVLAYEVRTANLIAISKVEEGGLTGPQMTNLLGRLGLT